MLAWQSDTKTFRESGSYRFTKEQRESYALILEVRIISFVQEVYYNSKSLPDHGFWGYATVFEGAVCRELIQVQFSRFRLLNTRNNRAASVSDADEQKIRQVFGSFQIAEALDFVLAEISQFEGTPVLPHKETVIKFKGLPLSQFEFRCYWLALTDVDEAQPEFSEQDPTGGEDEFPNPTRNPLDNPYAGNPDPSDQDPDSDDRDYSDENNPPSGVFNYGFATYQFRDQSIPFTDNSRPDLGFPGILVPATDESNGQNAIDWEDADGVRTRLVVGGAPPVQVRNFQIQPPEGPLYQPFNDSLNN